MNTVGLSAHDLDVLVAIARRSIERLVRDRRCWRPDVEQLPGSLRSAGGAFVTLHLGGQLRGCVGRMTSTEPLGITVAEVARSSAAEDPRFRPVQPDELAGIEVSVSVLGPSEPLPVESYDELLRTVRPGIDGLTVEAGRHRATLLPAVWDDLPDAEEFLAALWRKAGLRPRAWSPDTVVSHYVAQDSARH